MPEIIMQAKTQNATDAVNSMQRGIYTEERENTPLA